MIAMLESVIGTVLSSFIVVIISSFMVLVLDFLFPSFSKWTRMFLFFIVLTVVLQPAFEHFQMIRSITQNIASMFISIYPLLTASIIASGGSFSMLNFQPAMLLFANGAVILADKILIPLLSATMLFDILSRLNPSIPFTKMADLLRTSLISLVSAMVAAYSIFITAGGTISWALTGVTSEPIKELIRQNIPLIGSFMTDSLGAIGRYSSGASVFIGAWLIITIWSVALLPTLKTLLTGFLYRWTAAIIEPFANEEITGILDDIGKTLFVLCAVSFLVAFAFIYTALFTVILVKLITVVK
ncbi:stage III sporulation protein AE [Sporosarcina thermotolerans]|uniref:Stage III sporulation protein AE n=1 Tax=Sporosarcina thermotolerans TaxID=633404 RepID=A0AAW9AAU0_9BACL|nr:stage III sporulation protein AE [Sporosarcina thermotolerans]MDW0117319.1 stage III sporulation protein AE [Sporosarcina thermotolerans]WHT47471.1 stage III sporulation protein AE [Sporosarcina thermotolerans]